MAVEQKCPKCGAKQTDTIGEPWVKYYCGTEVFGVDRGCGIEHETAEGKQCLRNQNAQLRKNLVAAEAVVVELKVKLRQALMRIDQHRSNSFDRAFNRKP